ncbi:MAG: hypothetical protein ABW352_01900 [Polyangiales bacterium]
MTGLRLRLLALASLAACTTDPAVQGRVDDQASAADSGKKPPRKDSGTRPSEDAGSESEPEPEPTEESEPEPTAASGMPCDVSALLAQRCQSCHGDPTQHGAPFSLVTREDLQAKTKDGSTRLEAALARAQDDKSPMPPAPAKRLDKAELASLEAYLAAGLPASDATCTPTPEAPDKAGAGATIPKPDDCEESFELTAHGAEPRSKFTMSSDPALEGNQYQCFYFDPPYGDDQVMYWFDSVLDNLSNLHHWILYGTDAKTQPDGATAGCNASQAGSYFIAGWAPGGTNGAAAGNVGLQLPTGPRAGLILEVHYYNNTGKPQQDASGIRFCTGKKAGREHLAAVHTLGSEGICIEPGKTEEVTGQCTPRGDMGDVHITGIWPHMHKVARHMKVTVTRAEDGSQQVIHDAPFDFNAQIFYPLDDVVLHPGDTVQTTCRFANDGNTSVHYGERTQDEMCYAFTAAWPAGALASAPSPFENQALALGNRCAEPLSILRSCNGAADAPMNATHPE